MNEQCLEFTSMIRTIVCVTKKPVKLAPIIPNCSFLGCIVQPGINLKKPVKQKLKIAKKSG